MNGTLMTSLPPAVAPPAVDTPADDPAQTSAQASRREQQTLTETLLGTCSRCPDPVDLEQQLHRAPSGHEVAHALGVDQGELSEAVIATGGYTALSLDGPTHPGSELSLGEELPDETDLFQAVERAEWLRPALTKLSNREQQIIQLRFAEGRSQEQIGHHLGVSQMQVSRLLKGILARLRDDLGITSTAAIA